MIQYFLYRLGMWVAIRFPPALSYKIASFIAVMQYYLCYNDRRAVINNLEIILNTGDKTVLTSSAKRVFINFAKYLVDFFRFSLVDEKYISRFTRMEGSRNVLDAFEKGNGVIALGAHVGNWELSGVMTASLGHPVNAIALSQKHSRINDLFVKQRESKGMKVVPLGSAIRRCFQALGNNELIGVIGDRDFTQTGVFVDFLGKKVRMPKGPALFSLKAGAPIIPTFMIRRPDDTYLMMFRSPIEYKASGDFNKDLENLTQLCANQIEGVIRKYPEQWFMFRRFWDPGANKV